MRVGVLGFRVEVDDEACDAAFKVDNEPEEGGGRSSDAEGLDDVERVVECCEEPLPALEYRFFGLRAMVELVASRLRS